MKGSELKQHKGKMGDRGDTAVGAGSGKMDSAVHFRQAWMPAYMA
jgi:hypothetical protein